MRSQRIALVSLPLLALGMMLFFAGSQPKAQSGFCSLALVLAIDASSSVDDREYDLQMKGIAAGLLDTDVLEAIESLGGIYIAAFEWNGRLNQKMLFDWSFVKSRDDALVLAGLLAKHERNTKKSPTALGEAMAYALRVHNRAPANCTRKVIDVSGDGVTNDGIHPSEIHWVYDFGKIVINGLVIKDLYTNPESFYRDPEAHYRQFVLHGPGSFIELAHGFDDFERAMRRKLLREIKPGPVGMLQ